MGVIMAVPPRSYPPLKDPRTIGEERRRRRRLEHAPQQNTQHHAPRLPKSRRVQPTRTPGRRADHSALAQHVQVRRSETKNTLTPAKSEEKTGTHTGENRTHNNTTTTSRPVSRPHTPETSTSPAPKPAPKPGEDTSRPHVGESTGGKRTSTKYRDSDLSQADTTIITREKSQTGTKHSLRKKKNTPPVTQKEQQVENTSGETAHENDTENDDTTSLETGADAGVNGASKILTPRTNIDDRKHAIPWWKIIVNVWVFAILVALIVLTALGYVWWNQESLEKDKNEAYEAGVNSAYAEPDVASVVRNTPEEINNLLLNTPGNGYPGNAKLTDITLLGWSIPGGSEGHGRATLSVCYTGDGVTNRLQSYAYLASDDARSQHPMWGVDTIDVTGEPCKGGK